MKQIHIISEPKIIESTMRPMVKEIIRQNIDKINLGAPILKRMNIDTAFENDWYCDVSANARLTRHGVMRLDLLSINKVYCLFGLQVDGFLIVDIKSIYINQNVEILNLDEVIRTINSSFCEQCGKRSTDCSCTFVQKNIPNHIATPIPLNSVDINYDCQATFEPELFDATSSFWSRPTEAFKEPEIDMKKYSPIIEGISKTFKTNIKQVQSVAYEIVANDPNISEEKFAAEIIKYLK